MIDNTMTNFTISGKVLIKEDLLFTIFTFCC